MNNLIETMITYDKVMENGAEKKVTESYMVDAMSFTEAEARIIKEMTPYIHGDFSVSAVRKAKINDLFKTEGGDRYYKARLKFITLDEKTGAEKETPFNVLIQADDFEGAVKRLNEGMRGTISDYRISSIAETKIIDIFDVKESSSQK